MPFGYDLVALVLEVVLGEPVAVVAELFRAHAHVEQSLLCVPEVLLLVSPAHRRRGTRPGIVDLDATEEEDPYAHAVIMTQRHVPASQLTMTFASSSPLSSCRKCPPPSIVVCGWPFAPGTRDWKARSAPRVIGS